MSHTYICQVAANRLLEELLCDYDIEPDDVNYHGDEGVVITFDLESTIIIIYNDNDDKNNIRFILRDMHSDFEDLDFSWIDVETTLVKVLQYFERYDHLDNTACHGAYMTLTDFYIIITK